MSQQTIFLDSTTGRPLATQDGKLVVVVDAPATAPTELAEPTGTEDHPLIVKMAKSAEPPPVESGPPALSERAFITRVNTLGQKSAENSTSVVVAKGQPPIPVVLTERLARDFYAANICGLATGEGPTDLLVASGAKGKVVSITRIYVATNVAKPTGLLLLGIRQRTSLADNGGKPFALLPTKYDPRSPEWGASVTAYAAPPKSTGKDVGVIAFSRAANVVWDYSHAPIVLPSPEFSLVVTIDGVKGSLLLDAAIEWFES